jgi:hypothetical protein
MSNVSLAAIAPLVVVAVGFVVYCWIDLAKSRTKYLPRWAWAVCMLSVPLGGILYLIFGRDTSSVDD